MADSLAGVAPEHSFIPRIAILSLVLADLDPTDGLGRSLVRTFHRMK
ncbi:hypothetical protein EZH22_15805 [Xanthobacter dioxanivorans]|uniref:Uncharacterized protein n=1 Tax=Xanthobacter dioxanivorans TaxID=2528964 RepID=A0A974SGS5_9HYPH|nr:hypothetical protein [Xanthobacter dioxanivorans]QRG04642.1 hypothetical protein EZH22_15805 [Xanthobacter dioxanivorans]